MQRDAFGRPYWESFLTPASYQVRAEARVPPHLPGIIIFVHGVNSEGEWYDKAEQALCEGLNERLGLHDSAYKLKPNEYVDTEVGRAGKKHTRRIKADNPGYSPVIRFYWGYRAPDESPGRFKIPLRNIAGADF